MAASFKRKAPVLDYGPHADPGADPGGRNAREYILWPSWAFRVVAPVGIQSRHINELQKAVLGILRASRLTAIELGERLGIEPELATFVVSELQEPGWVSGEWEVTDRGNELLEEEREESVSLVSGWVFKDPWNGQLWPFVAPRLQYAQTEMNDSGYPELIFVTTTGHPWCQSALTQHPPNEYRVPKPPDVQEIIDAVARHKRQDAWYKRQETYQENIESWTNGHSDLLQASRIRGRDLQRRRAIEAKPQPVFLVSFLYVPRAGDDASIDWYACDFFGRGSDPALRRLITQVASEEKFLAQRMQRLLGRTIYGSFEGFENEEKDRKHRASKLLKQLLLDKIGSHPLVEVLEGWLELCWLQKDAGRRHRRNVLVACRVTLEWLFGKVAHQWPLADVHEMLSRKDTKINRKAFRDAANAVGLTNLPQRLCNVSRSSIRSASKRHNQHWRLSSLVAATLLQAQITLDHPLRTAAEKAPDFLARVERVIDRGNSEAHNSKDKQFNLNSIRKAVEDTLEIVGLLLNVQTTHIKDVLRQCQQEG